MPAIDVRNSTVFDEEAGLGQRVERSVRAYDGADLKRILLKVLAYVRRACWRPRPDPRLVELGISCGAGL
jgi:hypothetical protein